MPCYDADKVHPACTSLPWFPTATLAPVSLILSATFFTYAVIVSYCASTHILQTPNDVRQQAGQTTTNALEPLANCFSAKAI